jgi:hypothetical protein
VVVVRRHVEDSRCHRGGHRFTIQSEIAWTLATSAARSDALVDVCFARARIARIALSSGMPERRSGCGMVTLWWLIVPSTAPFAATRAVTRSLSLDVTRSAE